VPTEDRLSLSLDIVFSCSFTYSEFLELNTVVIVLQIVVKSVPYFSLSYIYS
jgi:hypothetical protein